MALSKYFVCALLTLYIWQISNFLNGTNGRQNSPSYRLKSSALLRPTINIREKIIEWQCYARCSASKGLSSIEMCKIKCKSEVLKTPRAGQCPTSYSTYSKENELFRSLACLDECNIDFDCPDVQKCCNSECGPVCQQPVGIRENELLPPIPKILHLKLPKGHKVEITIQTSANTTIYYHVETRYHIGLQFSKRKLSAWQWQPVEMTAEEILENRKKRIQICFNLKPGRWYQVRIAAINANGFRGYSEPSKSFTLSKNPRPPMAPTDLQVIKANFNGKHYSLSIVWCPSKSNLPIEKYKIIWSLYVKSKEESIISSEAFVRDVHQFEMQNLLPESSYYIQVLAMCIIGRRRLKSDKISILFNTTNALQLKPLRCFRSTNNDQYHSKKHTPENDQQSTIKLPNYTHSFVQFEVRFRLNQKFGLIVQISGFEPDREKFFELCSKASLCDHKKYSAIRSKKNTLEFNKLKYNTTYFLKAVQPSSINELFQRNQKDEKQFHSFSFKTPKCENFKKRFPQMKINC